MKVFEVRTKKESTERANFRSCSHGSNIRCSITPATIWYLHTGMRHAGTERGVWGSAKKRKLMILPRLVTAEASHPNPHCLPKPHHTTPHHTTPHHACPLARLTSGCWTRPCTRRTRGWSRGWAPPRSAAQRPLTQQQRHWRPRQQPQTLLSC